MANSNQLNGWLARVEVAMEEIDKGEIEVARRRLSRLADSIWDQIVAQREVRGGNTTNG